MELRALFYLFHARYVVVAAAYDADDVFAADFVFDVLERGYGDCARGLDYHRAFVVEAQDGGAYLAFGDGHQFVDHFPADVEGYVADLADGYAVCKVVYFGQRDRFAFVEGGAHGGRAGGFYADYAGFGAEAFEYATDARHEAAAADGEQDVVEVAAGFVEYVEAEGGLSFDYLRVVEGVDEGPVVFAAPRERFGARVVVGVSREDYVDVVFAEHFDLVDFLVRRGLGHEDGAHYAEFAAGERDALRVVARGGADYAARELFGREACDFVVRAADFVGAHYLHVFALEPDVCGVALGELGVERERRVDDDAADALFGFLYVVELRTVVGHFGQPTVLR